MRAGHEQLKELIKADSFDEAAVTALAEKEGALTAERLISQQQGHVKGLCSTDG